MINNIKDYELMGDMNPVRERMEVVEFPSKLEELLKEMLGVGSKSLSEVIDRNFSEKDNVSYNGSSNEPMSNEEENKYMGLLHLFLMETYFKMEKLIVHDRENYKNKSESVNRSNG